MSQSMTFELIHALPIGERRVFSRNEAASYLGVSPGFFAKLVREGRMPPALPLGKVKRWDRHDLDQALNKLSGLQIDATAGQPISDYEAWKQNRG